VKWEKHTLRDFFNVMAINQYVKNDEQQHIRARPLKRRSIKVMGSLCQGHEPVVEDADL
jgi:hypothetical protein